MPDRESRSRWLIGTVVSILGAGAGLVAIAQFVAEPRFVMSDLELNTDRYGNDIRDMPSADEYACSDACLADPDCQYFSFNVSAKQCWLKKGRPDRVVNSGFISGAKLMKPWWKIW